MNNNDCFVVEREDSKQFSEDVTFAMNKGYKVSSTSIAQYTEHDETKIKYIAIMISNVILPTTKEEYKRDMNIVYNQALEDVLEKWITRKEGVMLHDVIEELKK